MATLTAAPALPPFLTGYQPGGHAFDELYERDGNLRPQWQYLIRSVGELGSYEFERRCAEGRRLLHEGGVTYNAYGEAGRGALPWPLDPMPILIASSEWQAIEESMVQRAELMEAILADLYGERQLITKGLLPATLIYGHSGFLRPCAGIPVTGERHLPIYSADLARAPDGSFLVLGDRAQAPSGSGYALQNRVIMSHVLPSIFRDSHVHRLRFYFRRLRAMLFSLAPYQDEQPHIVLLTPGPGSETYFEHTYLANYLGCTLVQGDDLTVFDQKVWLRTLDGLQRVDVILRRLDGVFCDPLELRSDSLLGTPGLLQAARAGNVAIVNPIGCSAIENPGLMAFLPALAKHLLGHDLKMPSVRTWWCGDDDARRFVLEHLEELVVKPITPHASDATRFGAELDSAARERLVAQIEEHPHLYVGQEYIPLSTAPVVADGRLEPRAMVVRGYVTADTGGYTVMPGGLCRVASSAEGRIVSNHFGGVSKDVWVLASEPEREIESISLADRPLAVERGGTAVGGRVADNLYWVGRYSERVEVTTRILREIARRALETDVQPQQDPQMRTLLRVVADVSVTYPQFLAGLNTADDGIVNHAAVLNDELFIGTVRNDIHALLRAAQSARDQFSYDTWRVITAIGDEAFRLGPTLGDFAGLERLLTLLAAFGGLSADSMTRGARWQFLEIGRCLERGLGLIATLRAVLASGVEGHTAPWREILALADSQTAFHLRYRSTPTTSLVLDLLIDEGSNPRSLVFQLLRLEVLLLELAARGGEQRDSAQLQELRAALSVLQGRTAPATTGPRQLDGTLEEPLRAVALHLAGISELLEQSYFRQPEGPRLVTSYT